VKTEPSPQIVEMIDDDGDAFADRSVDRTGSVTGGGLHWIGQGAAVALIAVVGYGVISSAVGSDSRARPTTPGLIDPQYYVADPPPEFTLYLAEDRDQAGAPTSHFAESGPAQLWATNDATGTQGSWFVVSKGVHHATGRNAYRTLVDGVGVVIERDPSSRQSRVSFTKNGTPLEITAFGWLDRQLVRLVRSVSVDDSVINFSNEFFATDHRHILDADPDVALLGLPVARVEYTTAQPSGLEHRFTITVSGDTVVNPETVVKFALARTATFTVGDHPAIVGESVADPTVSIAQWHDDERLITVSGNLDPERLQAIAETVHRTSDDAVRKQLADPSSVNAQGKTVGGPPKEITAGKLDDGFAWAIQVSTADADQPAAGYVWWIGQPGPPPQQSDIRLSLPSGGPTIETFVADGRTYVVAKVPRSLAGAELHVNPTGLPSIVTPFLDVDPSMPDEFAAAAFVEPVPFAVQILDGSGAEVAVWPEF
jgi:hypothetical protein